MMDTFAQYKAKLAGSVLPVLVAGFLSSAAMAQDVPATIPVAAPDQPQAEVTIETLPTDPGVMSGAATVMDPRPPVDPAAVSAAPTGTVPVAENYATDQSYQALLKIAEAKKFLSDTSVTPENLVTLFFTAWQHALLQEAKIGFTTRKPNPGDVGTGGAQQPVTPGLRELSLGGIAYSTGSRWTIWLNGVRVTKAAIPEEVLDIKVMRSHIDLKWFDRYTNKVYPVRLRPHERFNLDTRIFLPGTVPGSGT